MEHYDIIVIGGVAAGTKTAAKTRREQLDWTIAIFTQDSEISYAGCGLPYYLGGVIPYRRDLIVRSPQDVKTYYNIDVFIKHRVESVDPGKKEILIRDIETGIERTAQYGKLVFATGAHAVKPPVPGIDLNGVLTLRTVADADLIKKEMATGNIERVVIVGGGFIGIEVAENLTEQGIGVTIVEMQSHILPPFDTDVAHYIEQHMKQKGVSILTGTKVKALEGVNGSVHSVKTSSGTLPADFVVWSTGVAPNSELAKTIGVELGARNAIKIDGLGRTNVPDIFAAGDCATATHILTGDETWIPMGSTANKQGRATGSQFQEGSEAPGFPGVLGTTIVKVFNMSAGRTGLSESDAEKAGIETVSVTVPVLDRAHYYPGVDRIIIKLIAAQKTGKLLGGQIYGEGIVDKPLDALIMGLTMNATVSDMAQADFAYAPPFSSALNPLNVAAIVLNNKISGNMHSISAASLHEKMTDSEYNGIIVDVREPYELPDGKIPGAINIPLPQIQSWAHEVSDDMDREIIVVCVIGKRAYEGYLRLKHAGYSNVKVLEGGMTVWLYDIA